MVSSLVQVLHVVLVDQVSLTSSPDGRTLQWPKQVSNGCVAWCMTWYPNILESAKVPSISFLDGGISCHPSFDTCQGTTKYSIPHRLARHVGLDPKKKPLEFVRVGTKRAKDFDDLYVGLGLGDEWLPQQRDSFQDSLIICINLHIYHHQPSKYETRYWAGNGYSMEVPVRHL